MVYSVMKTWFRSPDSEPACQCRRPKRQGFNPWIRKIPRRGHRNTLQHSCLENPLDRGSCWATVQWVAKSWTQLKWLSMDAHSCVHWRSTFNFIQVLFICICNLAVWCKMPSFQSILDFDMFSSLSLIISNVWFTVWDIRLFLSLELFETIVRFLFCLILILLYIRE